MSVQRILICMHDFARGGTERIAIGLAGDWAAMGRNVTILCGNESGGLRDMVDARVKVVALSPPIHRSALSRFRLGRAMGAHLATLRPDVIFLPGNFHIPLANALRRADPHPVIALKVSNPPLQGVPFVGGPLFRHFTCAVDGFAALTQGFAREMARLAPQTPVKLLHDPIYLRKTDATAARAGHILWAGRLEPQKDFPLALKTMTALGGDTHLVMLGDGALRDEAERMVARMGLAGRVTRLGHVPSIDPWLSGARALLMTSHYEGQPAVVGEALAHGVPVVSTDCCHMLHEIMTIPEAGRIVASRDPQALATALREVLVAPAPPRATLAALVADFTPEKCARAYLDWFDALARARSATIRS